MGLAKCWPNRGVRTSNHEGELSKAPELLAGLPLGGRVVTGDALYCQRGLCKQVVQAGGHYLVIVKKNQKTLYEDIAYLFAEPPPGEKFAMVELRGRHGDRREVRRLWTSTALVGYLNWPGVRQVCKVERKTERKGKLGGEVRYAITNLGEEAGPEQLLGHIRGHWAIENRLHYVRDVTFGEDASQVRKGSAPQVMAALRNAVISILRQDGWENIAAGLRHYGWNQDKALALLGLNPR
jgi:predicted transposase YbfD/YdcC